MRAAASHDADAAGHVLTVTPSSIVPHVLDELDGLLAEADAALAQRWQGAAMRRQPLHTLYLPADTIGTDGAGVVARLGREALAALDQHAPDAATMAAALGWPEESVDEVWARVRRKLEQEPVEDLRIDLEDGYGVRPDEEEDRDASAAARVLAELARTAGAPFSFGVRIKSLEPATRGRAVRTLDLVVATLVEAGGVPPGFVVTVPKVTSVDQVRAFVHVCERLEAAYRLPARQLRFEVQVETPQAIIGPDGTATVAAILHAAGGRCTGLHYGTYDYSASLGIAPAQQSMDHAVADHATCVMQVAAAGTGASVSHGSTNVLPTGDRAAVHAAWALHARLVRRSLERGLYQGWDLHPAQLATRYLATYAFYRQGLDAAAQRLRAYASSTSGGVLDEPATAFALASFLLRGVECGALDLDEVTSAAGLDEAHLARHARRPVERGASAGVAAFNSLPAAQLHSALLAVCASRRWAHAVAAQRPFETADQVQAAAEDALAALDESDLDQALAGHPRIGESAEGSQHAASRREQSGVERGDDRLRAALAEGNRDYERRFGHVYLVCATGRSGEELLAVLRSRLANDPATERKIVRDELAKINRIRLDHLLTDLGESR